LHLSHDAKGCAIEIRHGLLQATLVNQELIHAGEGPLHVF